MRSRRKTRREKEHANPRGPSGQSRYAMKVRRRQKMAEAFGVDDMPYPVLVLQRSSR